MLKEQLITLGFTPNEAEVYIALNELGQNKAGELIKKIGFHRNIVYEALDRLVERRLVAKTIRSGVAYFRVLDPSRLLEEIKHQETVATEVVKKLSERHEAAEQEVEVYEGLEGMKSYRNKSLEVLKPGEEILVLSGSKLTNEPLNDFWQKYHERRAKLGISTRMLFNIDSKKYGKEREKIPDTEIKYLPPNIASPTFWEIWGDRVGIGTMEGEPVLMSIKNKKVADGFRNYFNYLWGQKVKVYEGVEAAKQSFYDMADEMHLGEEYLVLGASWGAGKFDELYEFFKTYHQYRQKKGVRLKILFSKAAEDGAIRYKDNYKLGQVRILAQEISPTMQMNIFHDKVVMIIWQDVPLTFVIQNKEMANGLRTYFDSFWAQAEEFKM